MFVNSNSQHCVNSYPPVETLLKKEERAKKQRRNGREGNTVKENVQTNRCRQVDRETNICSVHWQTRQADRSDMDRLKMYVKQTS